MSLRWAPSLISQLPLTTIENRLHTVHPLITNLNGVTFRNSSLLPRSIHRSKSIPSLHCFLHLELRPLLDGQCVLAPEPFQSIGIPNQSVLTGSRVREMLDLCASTQSRLSWQRSGLHGPACRAERHLHLNVWCDDVRRIRMS